MASYARQPVRSGVFHELARSLCPECGQLVDAYTVLRDGAVYMRKRCPEHGSREALVLSDAEWYVKAARYNKPGAIPYEFATAVERGCPEDCGLCPEHQQHTCVGIIEITSRCNLGCPTCFADAGAGYDLDVRQVETILDRYVASERYPEVVQISGGEPTIHPRLLEILAAARSRNIRHVMLNTNGLRLAEDPEFVTQLAAYDPVIYLQFDGLLPATHEKLRGRDLVALKRRALDRLADAGMTAVLVATVVQGVNDAELGDILRFGLAHPAVRGVSFQPVTFAGRCQDEHAQQRTTVTGVLQDLEEQTDGLFRVADFVPVPCPSPVCSACTYAYVDQDQVVPIPRLVDVEDYLDFVTNRAAPDLSGEIREALEGLWSMAAAIGTPKTTADLTCVACGLDLALPADVDLLKEHFFMVQVHGFMDRHTFDVKRLIKCCIHELLPDGRAVPFCAYNNLGYREQVKREQEANT